LWGLNRYVNVHLFDKGGLKALLAKSALSEDDPGQDDGGN
jgi:hypothetical protein